MIWSGWHRALEQHQPLTVWSVIAARLLVAEDRDAVDLGDVDRVAGRVVRDVAGRRVEAVAALERRDGRRKPRLGEVLERGEHAAVDLAGLDVLAAARVDLDPLVGEHALLEQRLRQQQDLADREVRVLAVEGVLARRAVDRGRLEQLPAVEDRLRVDARRAAAGRADLEVDVRGLALDRCGRCGRGSCRRSTREPSAASSAGRPWRSGRTRARSSCGRS